MSENGGHLRQGDALLIIDVQNDFCPGGALPIADGHAVVPVLNAWIAAAQGKDVPIYASRDWHPAGHMSFSESGGEWPVHCLQDSDGAAFHPDLALPGSTIVVTKGVRFDKDQYSAFQETGLAGELRRRGTRRVWVGGLALDVCVKATALGSVEAGFETHLIPGASRPVTPEGGEAAVIEMTAAGVVVEGS